MFLIFYYFQSVLFVFKLIYIGLITGVALLRIFVRGQACFTSNGGTVFGNSNSFICNERS